MLKGIIQIYCNTHEFPQGSPAPPLPPPPQHRKRARILPAAWSQMVSIRSVQLNCRIDRGIAGSLLRLVEKQDLFFLNADCECRYIYLTKVQRIFYFKSHLRSSCEAGQSAQGQSSSPPGYGSGIFPQSFTLPSPCFDAKPKKQAKAGRQEGQPQEITPTPRIRLWSLSLVLFSALANHNVVIPPAWQIPCVPRETKAQPSYRQLSRTCSPNLPARTFS